MFGFFITKNICFVASYVLPAYYTYKSLQKERNLESALAHEEWLRYWMLLSIATVLEFYADMFIFWIPFYYELKLSFFLWLAYSRGADILYERVLRPRLSVHESSIDNGLEQVKFQIVNQAVVAGKNVLLWSQQKVLMIVAEGQLFAMKQMFAKAASSNETEVITTQVTTTPLISGNLPPKSVKENQKVSEENEDVEKIYPVLPKVNSKTDEEESLLKDEMDQFEVLKKEDMDKEELTETEKLKNSKSKNDKNVEKKIVVEKSLSESNGKNDKTSVVTKPRRNTNPTPPIKTPIPTNDVKVSKQRKTVSSGSKEH